MPIEQLVFEIGDKVTKSSGDYSYPGVVVAAFFTLSGKPRYVVECTAKEVKGMLHIFNGEQIRVGN